MATYQYPYQAAGYYVYVSYSAYGAYNNPYASVYVGRNTYIPGVGFSLNGYFGYHNGPIFSSYYQVLAYFNGPAYVGYSYAGASSYGAYYVIH